MLSMLIVVALPILADVFSRLGYMERQGSGLEKIIEWYQSCSNYTDDKIPSYSSTPSQFIVTLPNLNYVTKTGVSPEKQDFEAEKQDFEAEKQDFEAEKQDFEAILNTLSLSKPTRKNVLALYERFGLYEAFSRTDVVNICSITKSPASSLISFMNESGLIEKTATRGKYRFIHSNSK